MLAKRRTCWCQRDADYEVFEWGSPERKTFVCRRHVAAWFKRATYIVTPYYPEDSWT